MTRLAPIVVQISRHSLAPIAVAASLRKSKRQRNKFYFEDGEKLRPLFLHFAFYYVIIKNWKESNPFLGEKGDRYVR